MNNHYVFQSATLETILQQLEHYYPVQFNVTNKSLLKKRFSVTFHHNTIREIMEQLKIIGDIHYTIQQGSITIK
jgi:transmembrane sensor